MGKNEPSAAKSTHHLSAIPKPLFIRLLLLFAGGGGCLLTGAVVSMVTGDLIMLGMSAVLGTAFIFKGVLLKKKVYSGEIFTVSGVCISLTPKILGRYRRIELVNTDTGEDIHFILPKKVMFKVGHVYNSYFDHPISNRPLNADGSQDGFLYGQAAELDLPASGFLGFEDLGVYREKPVISSAASEKPEDIIKAADFPEKSVSIEEERP